MTNINGEAFFKKNICSSRNDIIYNVINVFDLGPLRNDSVLSDNDQVSTLTITGSSFSREATLDFSTVSSRFSSEIDRWLSSEVLAPLASREDSLLTNEIKRSRSFCFGEFRNDCQRESESRPRTCDIVDRHEDLKYFVDIKFDYGVYRGNDLKCSNKEESQKYKCKEIHQSEIVQSALKTHKSECQDLGIIEDYFVHDPDPDPNELEPFNQTNTDQLEPVNQVNTNQIEPVKKLNTEELEPVKKLNTEQLEPVNQVNTDQLELVKKLNTDQLEPVSQGNTDQLEPVNQTNADKLEPETLNNTVGFQHHVKHSVDTPGNQTVNSKPDDNHLFDTEKTPVDIHEDLNIDVLEDQFFVDKPEDQPVIDLPEDIPVKDIHEDKPVVNKLQNQTVIKIPEGQSIVDTPEYQPIQPVVDIYEDLSVEDIPEDQPVVDISEDQPVVDISDDQPVVDISEDQPVADIPEDQPVVDISEDQPAQSVVDIYEDLSVDTPEDQTVVDTPDQVVADIPKYQPVEGVPEDKPVVDKPEDKPVVDQHEDTPVVDQPEDKPVVDQPEDKPVVDQPEDKPVVDQPEDKPVVDQPEDKPVIIPQNLPVIEIHVVDIPDDLSVVDILEEQPIVDKPEDKPVVDQPEDKPFVDKLEDQLVLDSPEDQHVDEVEEQPVVDTHEDQHIVDKPVNQSVVDTPKDQPFVDKPVNQYVVDKPEDQTVVGEHEEQPVVNIPKEQPIVDLPEEQFFLDIPEDQPVVDKHEEQPVVDKLEEQPVVYIPEEQFVLDIPDDQPVLDISKDQPVVDKPEDQPVVDKPEEQPVVDKPEEQPAVDKHGEQPLVDIPKDQPVVDIPEEQFVLDIPDDQPVVDKYEDQPDQGGLEVPKDLSVVGILKNHPVVEASDDQTVVDKAGYRLLKEALHNSNSSEKVHQGATLQLVERKEQKREDIGTVNKFQSKDKDLGSDDNDAFLLILDQRRQPVFATADGIRGQTEKLNSLSEDFTSEAPSEEDRVSERTSLVVEENQAHIHCGFDENNKENQSSDHWKEKAETLKNGGHTAYNVKNTSLYDASPFKLEESYPLAKHSSGKRDSSGSQLPSISISTTMEDPKNKGNTAECLPSCPPQENHLSSLGKSKMEERKLLADSKPGDIIKTHIFTGGMDEHLKDLSVEMANRKKQADVDSMKNNKKDDVGEMAESVALPDSQEDRSHHKAHSMSKISGKHERDKVNLVKQKKFLEEETRLDAKSRKISLPDSTSRSQSRKSSKHKRMNSDSVVQYKRYSLGILLEEINDLVRRTSSFECSDLDIRRKPESAGKGMKEVGSKMGEQFRKTGKESVSSDQLMSENLLQLVEMYGSERRKKEDGSDHYDDVVGGRVGKYSVDDKGNGAQGKHKLSGTEVEIVPDNVEQKRLDFMDVTLDVKQKEESSELKGKSGRLYKEQSVNETKPHGSDSDIFVNQQRINQGDSEAQQSPVKAESLMSKKELERQPSLSSKKEQRRRFPLRLLRRKSSLTQTAVSDAGGSPEVHVSTEVMSKTATWDVDQRRRKHGETGENGRFLFPKLEDRKERSEFKDTGEDDDGEHERSLQTESDGRRDGVSAYSRRKNERHSSEHSSGFEKIDLSKGRQTFSDKESSLLGRKSSDDKEDVFLSADTRMASHLESSNVKSSSRGDRSEARKTDSFQTIRNERDPAQGGIRGEVYEHIYYHPEQGRKSHEQDRVSYQPNKSSSEQSSRSQKREKGLDKSSCEQTSRSQKQEKSLYQSERTFRDPNKHSWEQSGCSRENYKGVYLSDKRFHEPNKKDYGHRDRYSAHDHKNSTSNDGRGNVNFPHAKTLSEDGHYSAFNKVIPGQDMTHGRNLSYRERNKGMFIS